MIRSVRGLISRGILTEKKWYPFLQNILSFQAFRSKKSLASCRHSSLVRRVKNRCSSVYWSTVSLRLSMRSRASSSDGTGLAISCSGMSSNCTSRLLSF